MSLEIKLGDGAESIVISDHVSSLTATDRAQGWVASDVAIKLGAWSGRYGANFQLLDFSSFLKRLRPLSESLRGEAMLSSTDGYLDLTMKGDGLGHIAVTGEGWDRPRLGSHLEINYEIDQTFLPPAIAAVEEVLREIGHDESPGFRYPLP